MKFYETMCLILVGFASLSIAAPVSSEYENLELKDQEPGPGYGL